MSKKTGIEQALAMYGGSPSKLAAAIGGDVVRQHVEHWLKAKRVPAERCQQVVAATDGTVTLKELRPEDSHLIWPELATAKQVA